MAPLLPPFNDHRLITRGWTGPMLLISTKGGAPIDVKAWVQVMLSRHYNKPKTLGMMARLSMVHFHNEHTIVALSPDDSILRKIYARVMIDHQGVLKSNCSTYHFQIVGEGERERCNTTMDHYRWIEGLSVHRDQ